MKVANTSQNSNIQIHHQQKQRHFSNKSESAIIAKKGDSGYIKAMDVDGDGSITIDEFNQYCEDNGIIGEGKQHLMLSLSISRTTTKIRNKREEQRKIEEEEKKKKEEAEKQKRQKEQIEQDKQSNKQAEKQAKKEKISYKDYVKKSEKIEEVKAVKNKVEYKNDTVKKAIETYSNNNEVKEVKTSKEVAVYEKEA